MKNIMVCVTQQRNCDRLIKYGKEYLGDGDGELCIIHIAKKEFKFLGNSQEGEALEYLYQKSLEYGANLTVVRSDDVLETMLALTKKNNIHTIIMGESRQKINENDMVQSFKKRIEDGVEIITISGTENDKKEV